MKKYYLPSMLAVYVGLGVVIGLIFSIILNQFIPIPGELFLFFMVASVGAGILLGVINYYVFFFFTKKFIRHYNEVLQSVRNGDLSARSDFHSGGLIGELNSNINKTLANLEHSQKSTLHDDLTGLLNRQALQQFFLKEKERKREFALLFLDVDDFKQINDSFGHVTGDEVLRYISLVLHDTVAERGRVYRLSGDEFIIIGKLAEKNTAEKLSEDIHQAFQEPFHWQRNQIPIRVSIGICKFKPDESDYNTILDQADQDMYRHKNSISEWDALHGKSL